MINTFGKVAIVFLLLVGLQAPVLDLQLTAFAQAEQGENGADGEKGEKSEKGEKGEDGQDGQDGESAEAPPAAQDGEDGESGESGEHGQDGEQEEDGEDGGDATDGEVGGDGQDGANGQEGEDGDNGDGDNGEEAREGGTVVETGEATSVGDIKNTGNTNVLNGGEPFHEEELPLCSDKAWKDGGKGDKEGEEEGVSEHGKGDKGEKDEDAEGAATNSDTLRCREEGGRNGDTEVENTNNAGVGNTADVEADTGANNASGNNGSSTIDTGDAEAMLDIFNLVNTNITDSEGLIVLLSNLKKQLLDIDLRQWAPYLEEYDTSCGESCYTFGDLQVHNQNTASTTNDVVVEASTGGNEASENQGAGIIRTGNAYAGANIVNFANTNIVDSNYLMFVANNFGNFFGDIVFPNASSFFTSLFSSRSKVYTETEILNNNEAAIVNNVNANAETGENEVSGGNSVIQTGDANAAANVFNQVNMNLVGGNSFVALIRVSGDWSGDVFGLPEGISWKQTPNGIMLYSDDLPIGVEQAPAGEPETDSVPQDDNPPDGKGKGPKGSKAENSELEVANNNNATITNNVQVFALTGENKANGNGEGGTIQTGDAQAVANVVNVVNTNVIGKNWLFAMFNILGDFGGNISFGRPDLWIGSRAEIPNDPALPGDEITYFLTVANNGDIAAHHVEIKSVFDELLFSFEEGSDDSIFEINEVVWDLGTLDPGEGFEVSFTGSIPDNIPFGFHPFKNISTIGGDESDDNTEDNTDTIELVISNEEPTLPSEGDSDGEDTSSEDDPPSGGGGSGGGGSGGGSSGGGSSGGGGGGGGVQSSNSSGANPNLKVEKTYAVSENIYPGSSVDYTVVVSNMGGGSAYDAVLFDTLYSEDDEVIHEEVWDLGEVFPDEEITVTYTVVFKEDAQAGVYENDAYVEASNGISNIATTSLELRSAKELFMHIEEELRRVQEELAALTENVNPPVLNGSDSGSVQGSAQAPILLSYVPPKYVAEQKVQELFRESNNSFLASVAGFMQRFGVWFVIFAAAAMFLLFILLRRRGAFMRN